MDLEDVFQYKTADLFEASYLRAKGFSLIGTDLKVKTVFFIFEGQEVEMLANQWKFNPTEEMKTVKTFNTERENLFQLLKTTKEGGNYDR